MVTPVILSIAGYDPSSGAGITADIKTAASHGCYAVTCITALTVQSSQGVSEVQPLEPALVARTLAALAADVPLAAVRVGMLGSGAVAAEVAAFLERQRLPNIVLDPVLRSSSGTALLDEAGLKVLRERLLPICAVVTPNLAEAAELAGMAPLPEGLDWEQAQAWVREMAIRLHSLVAPAAVITGGHLVQPHDYLSYREAGVPAERVFAGEHVASRATHGTGCAFATALACQLGLGRSLPDAVQAAGDYVRRAIRSAYRVGKGVGPLNHSV